MDYTVIPGTGWIAIHDTGRGKVSIPVVAIYIPPLEMETGVPIARLQTGERIPLDAPEIILRSAK